MQSNVGECGMDLKDFKTSSIAEIMWGMQKWLELVLSGKDGSGTGSECHVTGFPSVCCLEFNFQGKGLLVPFSLI